MTNAPSFFDTHAHPTDRRFDPDRAAVLERARALGVAVLAAATDPEDGAAAVRLAIDHPHVHAAVGFYPDDLAGRTDDDWRALEARLAEDDARPARRVAAVGEIGLDYLRDRVDPAAQRAAFARQLALARAGGRPALVHGRKAEADVRTLLDEHIAAGGRAAWHCFTTGRKTMDATVAWAVERGILLGVGGMATWEDARALRDALARVPDALLLLETDAPYLNPRPPADPAGPAARRLADWLAGQGEGVRAAWAGFPAVAGRNEPAGVLPVAAALAALRGVSLADVARITTRNARALFGLPAGGDGAAPEGEIAYAIRDALYIALTNRCTNDCGFCARNTSWVVKGHDVRLAAEPDADAVMAAIAAAGAPGKYRELVFCGFGEPTLRFDVLAEVARRVRAEAPGLPIRVNTNGAGRLAAGSDLAPELARLVDTVSVSLNAADAATYAALCRPAAGPAAYAEVERFVRACVAAGLRVVCTAVERPGLDVGAVARRAEALGAAFRGRAYGAVG